MQSITLTVNAYQLELMHQALLRHAATVQELLGATGGGLRALQQPPAETAVADAPPASPAPESATAPEAPVEPASEEPAHV